MGACALSRVRGQLGIILVDGVAWVKTPARARPLHPPGSGQFRPVQASHQTSHRASHQASDQASALISSTASSPGTMVMGIGNLPALAPVASEETSGPGPAASLEA